MLLIGAGGPGCQLCLFHVANLFSARGMALNLITASIGGSFVCFEVLVRLSSHYGLSLQEVFVAYSALPFACTVVSFFTMSDAPFIGLLAANFGGDASPDSGFSSPRRALSFGPDGGAPSPTKRASRKQKRVRAISLGSERPMVFVLRKKTAPKLSLRERSCGLHERSSGLAE